MISKRIEQALNEQVEEESSADEVAQKLKMLENAPGGRPAGVYTAHN